MQNVDVYTGYFKAAQVKINKNIGNLIVHRHMTCKFAFMFSFTWVLLYQFVICVSFYHFQRGEHRQLPYNSCKAHAKTEIIMFWNNFCVLKKKRI